MEHSGEGTEKIKEIVNEKNKIFRRTITRKDSEDEVEKISRDDNESSDIITSDILPSIDAHPRKFSLSHFTVSPFDKRYRAWEGFLVLLVFYTAWVCPFEFGFVKKSHSHGALSITENVVNGFFAIDIVLRFFVAYLDKETCLVVEDRNKIAWRYAKSWFVLDLLSTIPTEVTQSVLPKSVASFWYFALLRLWRLQRASKMFVRLKKDRNYSYFWIRCSKLICVTLYAVHSAAFILMEAAKLTESCSNYLVEECKKRVQELEIKKSEAKQLERSRSESMVSIMKQLEESNGLLHDAESEISSLKEKVGLLEITIERDSETRIAELKQEIETLTQELLRTTDAKNEALSHADDATKIAENEALNNEKLAAARIQTLVEEKNDIIKELEKSREEEEKGKKAMESLASALHEASSEAREAKEQLLSFHAERESFETQLVDMKVVLKATNEKYEHMLDETKQDIDSLANSLEQSKQDYQKLKDEWEQKEVQLMHSVKVYEEKNSSMEKEINRLVSLLHEAEDKTSPSLKEDTYTENSIKEMESEVIHLKDVLDGAKAESMQLKERLLYRENELDNIFQENKELRSRDAASQKKVEELTKLLEEASSRKQAEENDELSENEKVYDMVEYMMSEQKHETLEDDSDSKAEGRQSFYETDGLTSKERTSNGGISLVKQPSQRKKKPLLQKFGSLLKRKGPNTLK